MRSRATAAFLFAATLALVPAFAQQTTDAPAQPDSTTTEPQYTIVNEQPDEARDIGWIHGNVIDPSGAPVNGGTVSLSTDGGVTLRYNIAVSAKGDYFGKVPLGEYTLVYRQSDTPEGQVIDLIHSVVILPGKDLAQNVDMTRQEFFDRLSPEVQDHLRLMRETTGELDVTNKAIGAINDNLRLVNQDFADAAKAPATAIESLGSKADASDIDSLVTDIRNTKYTEIQSLMSKAVAERPGEAVLWIYLGRAQVGLDNLIDAETSFHKAVDLASKADTPDPQVTGAAYAGLGEVYARIRMVDEANASFAAADKADPEHAAAYRRNLAVIFFQEKNAPAQIDAADDAIKSDPSDALLYFIKAEGLAVNAPVDPDSNRLALSPDCAAAFKKYLELAPNGQFAAQVNAILGRPSIVSASPTPLAPPTPSTQVTPSSPPAPNTPPTPSTPITPPAAN